MGKLILLVEDNPDNRLLIHMVLKRFIREDITLIDAEDGEVGLRLAFENQPDLILMDLKMPKMDGFEAIQKLKSDPATKDIPVLVLSAQAMEEDALHAMSAGASGFLSKPIDIPTFIETVKPFFTSTDSTG